MNKEISSQFEGKVVEILTSMQTAVGHAADFTMTQLPDIAQSYLMFGRAKETLIILFLIMIMGTSLFLLKKGLSIKSDTYEEENKKVTCFVTSAVLCICVLPFFFMRIEKFLMVWFAPKVWLLIEIAGIIR